MNESKLKTGWYWYHCGSPLYDWDVVKVDQSDELDPEYKLWPAAHAEGRLIGPIEPPRDNETYRAYNETLKKKLEEHQEWIMRFNEKHKSG